MSEILFRDGDWCLVKELALSYVGGLAPGAEWHSTSYAAIGHYCHGELWMIRTSKRSILNKRCTNCGVLIPQEMLGFQALTNWEK
jgi:hypothetical protein